MKWTKQLRYALRERRKVKNTIAFLRNIKDQQLASKLALQVLNTKKKEPVYTPRVINVPVAEDCAATDFFDAIERGETGEIDALSPIEIAKLKTLSNGFVKRVDTTNKTWLVCNLTEIMSTKKPWPKFLSSTPERFYLSDGERKSLWKLEKKSDNNQWVYAPDVTSGGQNFNYPEEYRVIVSK